MWHRATTNLRGKSIRKEGRVKRFLKKRSAVFARRPLALSPTLFPNFAAEASLWAAAPDPTDALMRTERREHKSFNPEGLPLPVTGVAPWTRRLSGGETDHKTEATRW